jgi:hypothetical protein
MRRFSVAKLVPPGQLSVEINSEGLRAGPIIENLPRD